MTNAGEPVILDRAGDRRPVQARGYTYASDSRGRTLPGADTELARAVAAETGWEVGEISGLIYDEQGRLLAGSVEELTELLRAAGVISGPNIIDWAGSEGFRGGAGGLGATAAPGSLSDILIFLRDQGYSDEALTDD